MTIHVEREQLVSAHNEARRQLLAERKKVHWSGELASSPLCTAAAISALVLAERHVDATPQEGSLLEKSWHSGMLVRSELSELITSSLRWLALQQNDDGGWGDADCGRSTLAATLMVKAAFHLTGVPVSNADLLQGADKYIEAQGGIAELKKHYSDSKPFMAAILADCAIAGLIPWRKVPSLPFEQACLPTACSQLQKFAGLSYSLPLLVSVGQAKNHHSPSRNLIARWMRSKVNRPSLKVLSQSQLPDGSFSASLLHTSLVVMCLASQGESETPVVRQGINYLLSCVRFDGSWAVCPDMAVSNTIRAIQALGWNFGEEPNPLSQPSSDSEATLEWLLSAQLQSDGNLTTTAAGWSSSTSPRMSPNTFDTAGALMNLADWRTRWPRNRTALVTSAALKGVHWLADRQNADGGWALSCRGSGNTAYELSCSDATCQAMLALNAWKKILLRTSASHPLLSTIDQELRSGLDYLKSQQRPEGTWWPRWSGSEVHSQHANPVVGTSLALRVLSELQMGQSSTARRALHWLTDTQFPSGSWGNIPELSKAKPSPKKRGEDEIAFTGSREETALAIEALLPFSAADSAIEKSVAEGILWLVDSLAEELPLDPTLVGFYPPKVWYYDRLLAPSMTVRALAAVCRAREVKSAGLDAVPVL